MKRFIFLIPLLLGCVKKVPKNNNTAPPLSDSSYISKIEKEDDLQNTANYCYVSVKGKDSIFLSYTVQNQIISGTLVYKNNQKKKSTGEISGKIYDDTLRVNYVNDTDGLKSNREIQFLQDRGLLLEGVGSQKLEKGIMIYSTPRDIIFGKGLRFVPLDCPIL